MCCAELSLRLAIWEGKEKVYDVTAAPDYAKNGVGSLIRDIV
jgi:hypothetical protein